MTSRDKDAFVRELAHELAKNFCTVWYDEFSLKVGDSLRACIERGLRETKKCIVVLSPNFLSNDGWGRAEFDSIFTREILEKQNVILPVWLNVDVKDVYNYSPRLADKVGLAATLGVPEVARLLAMRVRKRRLTWRSKGSADTAADLQRLCYKIRHHGGLFKCFMRFAMGLSLEARFEKYSDTIVNTLMHADSEQQARWYIKGLMLPGERKSVEQMAARVQPQNVRSAHE